MEKQNPKQMLEELILSEFKTDSAYHILTDLESLSDSETLAVLKIISKVCETPKQQSGICPHYRRESISESEIKNWGGCYFDICNCAGEIK